MIGSVTYTVDSGWMPPVDYVLEVYGDTSPAELFDGTVWMPLRDCIIWRPETSLQRGQLAETLP